MKKSELFIEDLKKEWCRSNEQHKSFERDLMKLYSILDIEKGIIKKFYCGDYDKCEKQCNLCKLNKL